MFINLYAVPVAVATPDRVATFLVNTSRRMGVEVKNTGANALDVFEVWGRFSPDGNLIKLASLASDFTTPVYPIINASGSPVALAAGATAWLVLNVEGLAEVQFKASSSGGVTTLEFHAASKFST